MTSTESSAERRPAVSQPQRASTWPMWVLGLVLMIDQIDQNIVRGVVTPLKHDFHLSDLAIGILLSSFILVNGIVSVPAGYLADRWHRTRTVGHTIVAWSGITALTAAAPNFPTLLAVRSALGVGQAVTEPSAASLLADYYPAEQRGQAFSVQQCLLFVGFGIGLGLGGYVGKELGWRWAFLLVGTPGVLIALAVYRLHEPRRGHGDRLHLGIDQDGVGAPAGSGHPDLLAEGVGQFVRDMLSGLRADLRTIWNITTMRYALVGVSSLLFTVTAVAAALPQFYERNLHVAKGDAELYVGALIMIGGIPGVLLGGRLADRYLTRVRGARVAIPAYCIMAGTAVFAVSYLWLGLVPAFLLEVLGAFIITLAIPALRAGLSDAIPANLRGAGFGAFNVVSVIFGQAAASVVVFGLSNAFGNDLRTALLLVSPPVFLGGVVLLRARDHLDADAAKIFQAILTAMQEQQEREAREQGSG